MNESIPLPLNGQPQALETLQQCLIGFECKRLPTKTVVSSLEE